MSNYKDRGIMKWAPFDALEGHGAMLEDLIYNLAKKDKSILSEDYLQELDETFKDALDKNKYITISYYQDGYTLNTYGKIKKIDNINKQIILDTEEKIEIDSVLKIEAKK